MTIQNSRQPAANNCRGRSSKKSATKTVRCGVCGGCHVTTKQQQCSEHKLTASCYLCRRGRPSQATTVFGCLCGDGGINNRKLFFIRCRRRYRQPTTVLGCLCRRRNVKSVTRGSLSLTSHRFLLPRTSKNRNLFRGSPHQPQTQLGDEGDSLVSNDLFDSPRGPPPAKPLLAAALKARQKAEAIATRPVESSSSSDLSESSVDSVSSVSSVDDNSSDDRRKLSDSSDDAVSLLSSVDDNSSDARRKFSESSVDSVSSVSSVDDNSSDSSDDRCKLAESSVDSVSSLSSVDDNPQRLQDSIVIVMIMMICRFLVH